MKYLKIAQLFKPFVFNLIISKHFGILPLQNSERFFCICVWHDARSFYLHVTRHAYCKLTIWKKSKSIIIRFSSKSRINFISLTCMRSATNKCRMVFIRSMRLESRKLITCHRYWRSAVLSKRISNCLILLFGYTPILSSSYSQQDSETQNKKPDEYKSLSTFYLHLTLRVISA